MGMRCIATCVLFDRPRDYTVHVRYVAYAQRQAQQLWTQCAEVHRWDWLQRIRMEAADTCEASLESRELYDLIYQWLPYDSFDSSITMRTIVTRLSHMLRRGGEAFVVGPVRPRGAADAGTIAVAGALGGISCITPNRFLCIRRSCPRPE